MSESWLKYDFSSVAAELVNAKAMVITLKELPFYREWTNKLQQIELRREIEGTTRIEGAAFTERELDQAISESTGDLLTRSQRQGRAMKATYDWIADIPRDEPITAETILNLHSRIITGADDDHCTPGQVRMSGENVTFGQPRRRGVEGGTECMTALVSLTNAIQSEYQNHDPLIQPLAIHYHIGAIHPFSDGNGRTARALEALMLKRAGFHDTCFVSMSNYYYEERVAYLKKLSDVYAADDDLTSFLKFGLRGIALQGQRLLNEIKPNLKKVLFRSLMYDLFDKLDSPRKRVLAKRQIAILEHFLDEHKIRVQDVFPRVEGHYNKPKYPMKAYFRDMDRLLELNMIRREEGSDKKIYYLINLDWPTQITETEFFDEIKRLPKAKSTSLQASSESN